MNCDPVRPGVSAGWRAAFIFDVVMRSGYCTPLKQPDSHDR
jgi:hypothetical protein